MSPDEMIQTVITAILSSGLVSGVFALIMKKSQSPESQNDLARLGNEFAAQLLKEAKEERAELRASIAGLEQSNDSKQESIDKLKALLKEKDERIEILERHQQNVAEKLQRGEPLTLADIFGRDAPNIQLATTQNHSIA